MWTPFASVLLCSQVLPQVEQPQTGMNEGVKVGLIGIGALVALGGAFFVGRKLLSSQLPKVQKVRPRPFASSGYWQLCWEGPAALQRCRTLHIRQCLVAAAVLQREVEITRGCRADKGAKAADACALDAHMASSYHVGGTCDVKA